MSVPTEFVAVKEEVSPHEEYLLEEDDIKIEETCLQSTNEDSFVSVIAPRRVVMKRKLLVCSICRCTFERKAYIKLQHRLDVTKCYKCILHARLSQVFTEASDRRKKKNCLDERTLLKKTEPEVIEIGSDTDSDYEKTPTKSISVTVTKIMYVCVTCKTKFERKNSTGLRQPSDWHKCNRCILHSHLHTVFHSSKYKKRKS